MKTQTPPAAGQAACSPLPWVADGHYIHSNGNRFLAVAGDLHEKTVTPERNAAFIVRACNSHAALVAALSEALEWTRGDKDAAEHGDMKTEIDAETLQARVQSLRAALQSAKE